MRCCSSASLTPPNSATIINRCEKQVHISTCDQRRTLDNCFFGRRAARRHDESLAFGVDVADFHAALFVKEQYVALAYTLHTHIALQLVAVRRRR